MDSSWTIVELAELAGAALADEPVRVNGRVRDVPNERLVRWYTTIGLVDPPIGRRGRTALYGPRHLLQLVAIKRRQATGRTIAEIQAELTGATDAALREIARLPDTITTGTTTTTTGAATGTITAGSADATVRRPRSRARFWTTPPAPSGARAPMTERKITTGMVAAVRPAPGVTIVLDSSPAALTPDDVAAIEAAARPLVDELRRRGLSGPSTETGPPAESGPPAGTGPSTETEPTPPESPGRSS
jgi:DNA-binding transcriptional MerR regulator